MNKCCIRSLAIFFIIFVNKGLQSSDKIINIQLCVKEIANKIKNTNYSNSSNYRAKLTLLDYLRIKQLDKNVRLAGVDKLKLIPLLIELDSIACQYNIIPQIANLRKNIRSQINDYTLSDNDTFQIDVNRLKSILFESPFRSEMNIFDINIFKGFNIHPAEILKTIIQTDIQMLEYDDDFIFSNRFDYFLKWVNHEHDTPFITGLNKYLDIVKTNKSSACYKLLSQGGMMAFGTDNDPPSEIRVRYIIKRDQIISEKEYDLSFKYLDMDPDIDVELMGNILHKYKIPVRRTLTIHKGHNHLKEENYQFGAIYRNSL